MPVFKQLGVETLLSALEGCDKSWDEDGVYLWEALKSSVRGETQVQTAALRDEIDARHVDDLEKLVDGYIE